MEVELDKVYEDRRGVRWKIIATNGQRLFPVSAARWEDKSYQVRCFQRDGRYFTGEEEEEDSPLDLVKLVNPTNER